MNDFPHEFEYRPKIIPECDYCIVTTPWDLRIDFERTFRNTKKAVLFLSSGCAEHGTDKRADKKRADEAALIAASKLHGFEAKIARGWSFIGPRLPEGQGLAAAEFLKARRENKPLTVMSPDTVRSYLHPADMAIWLWHILFRGRANVPYNVGSEMPVTIGELAEKIWPKGPKFYPAPQLPATAYVPDTSLTRRELGVSQHINLDDAIARTLKWQLTA